MTVNDWRQRWTHSLAFGLALAAAATILLGIRSLPATLIPFILHVAWDQAGFQGCSFFWPFSGRKLSPRMWTSNPYSPRTVATLTWMVLICLFLSIRTQLSPAGTAPFRVIFYGISVPVIIWGIPRVWKNLRNGAGKRRLSVKTHVRRTIA